MKVNATRYDLDQAKVGCLVLRVQAFGSVIQFTREDIVRSGVCAMWVRAFDEARL